MARDSSPLNPSSFVPPEEVIENLIESASNPRVVEDRVDDGEDNRMEAEQEEEPLLKKKDVPMSCIPDRDLTVSRDQLKTDNNLTVMCDQLETVSKEFLGKIKHIWKGTLIGNNISHLIADVHDLEQEESYRKQIQNLNQFLDADVVNDWMFYLIWKIKEDYGRTIEAITSWIVPDLEKLFNESADLSPLQRKNIQERIAQFSEKINWKESSMILLPIHLIYERHWTLVIIDLVSSSIELWDSLHNKQNYEKMQKLVLWWLTNYTPQNIRSDVSENKFHISIGPSEIHQLYGVDCGAYVCFYAYKRVHQEQIIGTEVMVERIRQFRVSELPDRLYPVVK